MLLLHCTLFYSGQSEYILSTVILSHIHIFHMFSYYMSCKTPIGFDVYLTVLLTVILSHIHISLMFCYYISCIYSYKLWNTYIKCIINCNNVPYSYFPHILSLHILYIQLQTLKCINCTINCNIVNYACLPLILILLFLYIQLQMLEMY